jgi:DNA-directed RNA polymerase specialized sigma24 family protein
MSPKEGHGHFPATHWTLIQRLRSDDAVVARRALNDLCTQYYYPLYCYIRRRGFDHHDAEDALHDFFSKLLRLEALSDADAAKGRLRSFLSTMLQRFLINWRRDHYDRSKESDLNDLPVGIDAEERYEQEQLTEHDTPETLFDRKWSHEMLVRVLNRLGESYAAKGKTALFQNLEPVLQTGGSLRGHDATALAASLSMTEGALRVSLSRLLKDYRTVLDEEVLQTVHSPDEVDAEIAHLLEAFRRA